VNGEDMPAIIALYTLLSRHCLGQYSKVEHASAFSSLISSLLRVSLRTLNHAL
jgi:hypothetical protein